MIQTLRLIGPDSSTVDFKYAIKGDDYAHAGFSDGENAEIEFQFDQEDLDHLIEWAKSQKDVIKGKTPS